MTDEHLEQMRSLAADWKAVKYTGSEDDYVVVATTDEAVSMWDRIESMQAAEITVGEVNELRAEIERLRGLITAWADADDVVASMDDDDQARDVLRSRMETTVALRKAIGR